MPDQHLQHAVDVAAVPQVGQPEEPRPRPHHLQPLARLGDQIELKADVLIDLQLGHRLGRLGALHHANAPVRQVLPQLRIQHHIVLVRRVRVDVRPRRRDRPQLHHQRILLPLLPHLLIVPHRRPVPPAPVPLRPPPAHKPVVQIQPQAPAPVPPSLVTPPLLRIRRNPLPVGRLLHHVQRIHRHLPRLFPHRCHRLRRPRPVVPFDRLDRRPQVRTRLNIVNVNPLKLRLGLGLGLVPIGSITATLDPVRLLQLVLLLVHLKPTLHADRQLLRNSFSLSLSSRLGDACGLDAQKGGTGIRRAVIVAVGEKRSHVDVQRVLRVLEAEHTLVFIHLGGVRRDRQRVVVIWRHLSEI